MVRLCTSQCIDTVAIEFRARYSLAAALFATYSGLVLLPWSSGISISLQRVSTCLLHCAPCSLQGQCQQIHRLTINSLLVHPAQKVGDELCRFGRASGRIHCKYFNSNQMLQKCGCTLERNLPRELRAKDDSGCSYPLIAFALGL